MSTRRNPDPASLAQETRDLLYYGGEFLNRRIPFGVNLWYSLGSATLFVFVLQAVTGILLAMNYVPSPELAYDSVRYISDVVPFGWIIRGIHHWGASAMVVLVGAHMATAFVLAAYQYPRQTTWVVGVILLLITLGFGFTGYLLPWDQKAYWATTVGTNMPGTVPLIGSWLIKLIRGGPQVGAVTLTRFYALHVLVLPAIVGIAILVHVVLVVIHGVSVRPRLWHEGIKGATEEDSIEGLENDAVLTPQEHERRYRRFKDRGPRFWPEVIVEDLWLTLGIFLVLFALAVIAGVPSESRADPTDTAYIPRPEWYFLFLFQLLKIFPGRLEWVGVLLIPGAFIILLAIVPFILRRQERRPSRRRTAMAVTGFIVVAVIGLTVQAALATPPSVVVEGGVALTSGQLRGRQLVQQQGCRSCHVVQGTGDARRGPLLDGIGERMAAADIHFFMEHPTALNPAATMEPLIPPLSHADVEAITQYLLTLHPPPAEAAP